jgi:predicted nucleic acid-binding protein
MKKPRAGQSIGSLLAQLAQDHALSAYDAACLELAERRGLPLATFDRDLIRAARTAGVQLVES